MIPQTSEPCPLCHTAPEGASFVSGAGDLVQFRPRPFRDANKVCEDCWKEWNRLKQFEADVKAHITEPRKYNFVTYARFGGDVGMAASDELRRAWLSILQLIARPVPQDVPCGEIIIGSDSARRGEQQVDAGMFCPTAAEALQRLWQAINFHADEGSQRGRAEGSNLLLKLAAGEITTAELNDIVIGRKHRRNPTSDGAPRARSGASTLMRSPRLRVKINGRRATLNAAGGHVWRRKPC